MAESITLDGVDRGLVHALKLDGRIAFSTVAEVLDVSEHTVARRYRRLRAHGVLRVVGIVNGLRLGYKSWTIRIRCTPDAAAPIAAGLARRDDTFWIHVLSGGTEIAFNSQPRAADQLFVDKLPRGRGVLGVTAHELLPGAGPPPRWTATDHLTADQVARLQPSDPDRPGEPDPDRPGEPVGLEPTDHRMLERLSLDGPATVTELASVTGWSPSTTARRLEHLRRTGVLAFDVEIPPAALGYHAEARLWMAVQPAALAATAAALATHAEVSFAAVTTGPTNVVAQAICRDSGHLYRYLTQRVAGLPGVHTLETAPVLRTVKGFTNPAST